jgi:hypothetical protein
MLKAEGVIKSKVMKNIIKTAATLFMPGFARACSILIIGTITLLTINPISAQNGDPPPPPGEHGQNGNQPPGGGAPIAGGMGILLALGAAYGGKKVYDLTKKNGPIKMDG